MSGVSGVVPELAIVGGGAAGLAAAIFAGERIGERRRRPARIVILERAKRLGAKILVSGGGRCNVTHRVVRAEDFHGDRRIIRHILAAFDAGRACAWLRSLGVELKEERTGKVFPVSDRATTVVDALLRRCHELDIAIVTDCCVTAVARSNDGGRRLILETTQGTMSAACVILATGGRSLPRTGSDGTGWDIVRRLGHTVTDVQPALVPLVLDESMFHAELSGISHPAEVRTSVEGRQVDRRSGSLLWTHFGISGPVVLDSSRFWTVATGKGLRAEVHCNFCPGEDFQQVDAWFLREAAQRPTLGVAHLLARRLPDRLARALCRTAEIDHQTQIAQVPAASRRRLIHSLTKVRLPVRSHRGWNHAEVTAGGVPLVEIDFRTMASRRVDGLYLVGEMLDCDGRIGGFNFQWAWATGYVGGRAAAAALAGGQTSED